MLQKYRILYHKSIFRKNFNDSLIVKKKSFKTFSFAHSLFESLKKEKWFGRKKFHSLHESQLRWVYKSDFVIKISETSLRSACRVDSTCKMIAISSALAIECNTGKKVLQSNAYELSARQMKKFTNISFAYCFSKFRFSNHEQERITLYTILTMQEIRFLANCSW